VEEVMTRMREAGLSDTPVIVGGIIPDEDARRLLAMGVAKVYTPKDFQLNAIMMDVVSLADPKPVAAE
jgi:(2R)-ethylmalonyl-CoA mutase